MFMFRIDHKSSSAFWLHDPANSAPAAMKPEPDRTSLVAAWARSRLEEEHRRDVDLSASPPRPYYPIELVMTVYPSRN